MIFHQTRAVIFDLDGTLLDTLTDLMNAVNHALSVNGFPCRTREEVRRFVGNGLEKLVERALPDGRSTPSFSDVLAETRRFYAEHCRENTAPYAGIPEMLRALQQKGILLGVVSNKPDAQVKALCQSEFGDLITVASGASEGIRMKPAPDTLLACMEALGSATENTVYVGDSDVDIQTAANAGIPCVSVLWGFRDREFLTVAGAGIFAQSPCEICRFF